MAKSQGQGQGQWLDKARLAFFPGVFAVTMLAATSANAADVVGKWYGKFDNEPIISINKAGPQYSASLDNAESSRQIARGILAFQESIDKSLLSFKVADGNVQFSIRSLITLNGDINYERDTYDLSLSQDGRQLTGTEKIMVYADGSAPLRTGVTPITLFLGD